MTLTQYEEKIHSDVRKALESAGLVNGDLVLEKDYDSRKTYFFEGLNDRLEMQGNTYVVYQLLSASVRQYHDNRMFGGQETVAVVINTNADPHSDEIATFSDSIEESLEDCGWQVNSRTVSVDPYDEMNQITFSAIKVFTRK